MSANNNYTGIGRLTRDPELSYTANSTAVTNFGVAIESRRFKKGDNWESKTVFLDCVLWGERAEKFVEKYKKGQLISVQGYLDQDEWEDKTSGQKRRKLNLVVENYNNVPGVKYKTETTEGSGNQEPVGAGVADGDAAEGDIPF